MAEQLTAEEIQKVIYDLGEYECTFQEFIKILTTDNMVRFDSSLSFRNGLYSCSHSY